MTADYASLVETFAVPHRAKDAFWRLIGAGRAALPAARAGLHHANADVRAWCCRYLDHFVDSASMDELVGMLDDPDPAVRVFSLHALSCDRCKENGACLVDGAVVLPLAIGLLRTDPDAHVRAHAVGLIGQYVHVNALAVAALIDATANDASPAVRKKARQCAPGGPIYKRTAPKPVRVKRNAAA
jgi:hypothetical protein